MLSPSAILILTLPKLSEFSLNSKSKNTADLGSAVTLPSLSPNRILANLLRILLNKSCDVLGLIILYLLFYIETFCTCFKYVLHSASSGI